MLTVGGEVQEVYIWILSGVLGFVITIGTIIITSVTKSLGEKLETLTESINELNVCTTKQTEQIKTLFCDKESMNKRLDDHASRIRQLEITK